jgi:hypothetical protein
VDPDNPSTQIIIDDAGNTFYLEDYRGEQYWWREERYSWMNPYIIGVTTRDKKAPLRRQLWQQREREEKRKIPPGWRWLWR